MAIEFDCPACGAGLVAADRLAGDVFPCDRCGAVLRVPDPPPPSDPDGGPRPRRRARPRPQPGGCGKVWFWLLLLGFLTILGCGGLVGIVFVAGGPQWQEFKSGAGGYTVDLPAAPRPDMAAIAANHGPLQPGVTYEGTILVGRLEEYGIVYADIEPGVRAASTDAEILDNAVKAIVEDDPPVVVKASRPVTVSGCPGRELELQIEGQVMLARVVVARTRLYTVLAGGPLTKYGEPRLKRFVESFRVTDPRFLPAAKPAD